VQKALYIGVLLAGVVIVASGLARRIFLGGRYEDAVTRQNAPVATGSRRCAGVL
jgi:hypothetical protein